MAVLVIGDVRGGALDGATLKSVTAAKAIDADVDILIAGEGVDAAAASASDIVGVRKVLRVDDGVYDNNLAEPLADLIVALAGDYAAIVKSATSVGKNVLPRVAALLDVMQVSEVTEILAADTFVRPTYAGNAMQTVKSNDRVKVITVRVSSFDAAQLGGSAPTEAIDARGNPELSCFVGEELTNSERPELTGAKIVISGGRSLGSSENFMELIFPLADKLGAAVGASRAAVDAGYVPNDYQVGQTGKVVAPELYIAVGISGAIQHLAGMKDSKVIVAINSDEEAPIFHVADYGLVADLFEALPELNDALC